MITIITWIIKIIYNNNKVQLIVLIILIPINHNNNMNCPIQSFPKYFISILLTLLTKSTNELYDFKTSLILLTIETIINHFLSGWNQKSIKTAMNYNLIGKSNIQL